MGDLYWRYCVKIIAIKDGKSTMGTKTATVTIQYRTWFGKKYTEDRDVYAEKYSSYWRWKATGKFTPNHEIEHLYSAYKIPGNP